MGMQISNHRTILCTFATSKERDGSTPRDKETTERLKLNKKHKKLWQKSK
jgi:hypothetical protein